MIARAVLACAATLLLLLGAAGTASAEPVGPYVALGDSYTSSPLTGGFAGAPRGCLRSTNDYPHLVAAALGAPLTDVSCAGATVAEFAGPQTTQFRDVNPPQYDALRPDTGLVTIGVGGNDIGFAEIVHTCLSVLPFGTPCQDRWTRGGTDELRARIDALGPRLAAVVQAVRERSPAARVVLVGYPSVLPTDGPGCYPAVPITPGDVAYLRGVLIDLNARIESSAIADGASYVDTFTPTVGHDICGSPASKWFEGLIPTAPAYPFHPNAQGSAAASRAVLASLAGAPD